MYIDDILRFYKNYYVVGNYHKEVKISNVTAISDKVKENSIFVAISGEKFNGVDFLDQAFDKGAILAVVAMEYKNSLQDTHKNKPIVFVQDTRDFLARINFYLYKDHIPDSILTVSGTNGKTSVSFFVSQLLSEMGISNMTIGTMGIYIDSQKQRDCLTTPSAEILVEYFISAKNKGINHVIMESSSHGIDQHRIDGINFKTAAFTNLSQDHLDYHKSMEDYFKVKSRLYLDLVDNPLVINADDEWGKKLINECRNKGKQIIEYGVKTANAESNLKIIRIVKHSYFQSVEITHKGQVYKLEIKLLGEFQVYNVICAVGMLLSCGFDIKQLCFAVTKLKEIEGRLNYISYPESNKKVKGRIFIDFAHTPNALEAVLSVLKKEKHRKLKVVFGCGGNRDPLKRGIMGEIASRYANSIYITDDNPRFEDPSVIREQVEKGVIKSDSVEVYNIDCRVQAINFAIASLEEEDILLIAGKGHENYQIVGDQIIEYSDKKTVLEALDKLVSRSE